MIINEKTGVEDYWLNLEPYTFIFDGEDSDYLIYNSMSHELLNISRKEKSVAPIIEALINPDNLYVVPITKENLESKNIIAFITKIRNGFFGDLLPKDTFSGKPAIVPPILDIANSVSNLQKDPELRRHENYLNFLHEFTIYINGDCNQNCEHCGKYYKQFTCCTKSKYSIPANELDVLLERLWETNVHKINIVGGDLFQYQDLSYILMKLEEMNIEKVIYTHISNSKPNDILDLLKNNGFSFNILVTPPHDDNENRAFEEKIKSIPNSSVKWNFIVSNNNELEEVIKRIEELKIENFQVTPFYNENLEFFEEHVFISKDGILNTTINAEDIYIRQSVNPYNYGKFIITSDQKYHPNINYTGNNTESYNILGMIDNELTEDSPWFLTRDRVQPCNHCSFRYLCPPPSNYEIVTDRFNFCSIYIG